MNLRPSAYYADALPSQEAHLASTAIVFTMHTAHLNFLIRLVYLPVLVWSELQNLPVPTEGKATNAHQETMHACLLLFIGVTVVMVIAFEMYWYHRG